MLRDPKEILNLWFEVDINDNGDIGLGEWPHFVELRCVCTTVMQPCAALACIQAQPLHTIVRVQPLHAIVPRAPGGYAACDT